MSLCPSAARAVRRLLHGLPPDDPSAVPDGPFRALVARLGSAPAGDRQGAFERFLEAREDADAIVEAVTRADPTASPPADDGRAGDDEQPWEPIRRRDPAPVDPFPLDLLPLAARNLARQAADSVGCPVDFAAAATLAVAAGTIGRSAVLDLKDGYPVSSALWIGIIGSPSDGKSPAVAAVFRATRGIDRELHAEHVEAMKAWRDAHGEKAGIPAPRPRKIDVDDATAEGLVAAMADNPRGLLQFKDELSEFLHGMDQYRGGGKGSDRPKYCSIWAGQRIKIDRAKNPANVPTRVDDPCLSLFGPLVPDRLGSLLGDGGGDGFPDRFLFSWPGQLPVPRWSERGIDVDVADEWRGLIRRLWDRPMIDDDGRPMPHVVRMTADARDAWKARFDEHSDEMNDPEFPSHLRGPWGKLREYAARLALVLALMHHADDPGNDPGEVPDLSPRDIDRAWELVAYFKSHARKVYDRIGGGNSAVDDARRVVEAWILATPRASFSESELTQARKTLRNNADLKPALAQLARDGHIRPAPEPAGPKPRSPRYLVHPDLAAGPAAAN